MSVLVVQPLVNALGFEYSCILVNVILKANYDEWLDLVGPDIEFTKQRFYFINSLAVFRNTLPYLIKISRSFP